MNYRPISGSEITALQDQGCFSSDWSKIGVSEAFSTDHIYQVRFSGQVNMGNVTLFQSTLENCSLGNGIIIEQARLVKNYRIGDGVKIRDVHALSVEGSSAFGNGTIVEALNEGGGREIRIFDRLSTQLAYLMVTWRHDAALVDALRKMVENHTESCRSEMGSIGEGAEILHSGTLLNLRIGEYAVVRGAILLLEGTLASNREAPVFIGENVIARHFIVQSGSRIDSGALLDHCFVGQAVTMGKQFSAENCLFFANCEAFHGEAVSVFAGPYTVTHHKSSLLIAGMYSFFNTGSGTNQSNHMYKLGPVHQGVLERGSKTGSFAYLLWPSRIGAFSVVMGKHLTNLDTSDFPFSYLNVDGERSYLTPGMNLFTVGTRRDSEKWPKRDKRKDPQKWDLICFELLNPYLVHKVIRAMDILSDLYEKTPQKQESVFYKGIRIKRLMLKSTRKYYEMALKIFLGKQLVEKLEQLIGGETPGPVDSLDALREALAAGKQLNPEQGPEPWIDLAGMIAPRSRIQSLVQEIASGAIPGLEETRMELERIHALYPQFTWTWTLELLSQRFGTDLAKITREELAEWVTTWENESIRLDKMILNDATKEFDDSSKIGFGIDGDAEVVQKDFEAVRGRPEENSFIQGLGEEILHIQARASSLRSRLDLLPPAGELPA
jgi:hypothetical protein